MSRARKQGHVQARLTRRGRRRAGQHGCRRPSSAPCSPGFVLTPSHRAGGGRPQLCPGNSVKWPNPVTARRRGVGRAIRLPCAGLALTPLGCLGTGTRAAAVNHHGGLCAATGPTHSCGTRQHQGSNCPCAPWKPRSSPRVLCLKPLPLVTPTSRSVHR